MAAEFRVVEGELVSLDGLTILRAIDFAQLIESEVTPNAHIVECRRLESGREAIVVALKPTVPQRPVVAIERLELVSVLFSQADDSYPEVRALRTDFPRERVLHLNGGVPVGEAPSLCLFAEAWPDVRLRLTANELLFRLQNWFNDSATGQLHRPDQPLEPAFLAKSLPLIISRKLLDEVVSKRTTLNLDIIDTPSGPVFIQHRPGRRHTAQAKPALVLPFVSQPHEHCVINDAPRTLEELDAQLKPVGIDILGDLQEQLFTREKDLDTFGFLVLLILLMRKRSPESEPEPELISFFCISTNATQTGIHGIFRDIGFTGGIKLDDTRTGKETTVTYLSVRFELTPELASLYSGNADLQTPLVAVGAGALGSQVVMNAVRGGLTNWKIIDDDNLMPHNLVRHSLYGDWLGCPKATAVASEANSLLDTPSVEGIVANVLAPGTQAAVVQTAMEEASVIVDLSASAAVARHLARDVNSNARRCSIFVSPSGRDLVFMGEDEARSTRLDVIEAQYYRAAASLDSLQGHQQSGQTVGSCRDITTLLPQSLMAIHAAQAERLLRSWLTQPEAQAVVLRASDDGFGFDQTDISLGSLVEVGEMGSWTVLTDTLLLEEVTRQREDSLPNETGGVLLAHVDVQRRTLYVSHQIPAPPDSERQPTVYIRGNQGLFEEYDRIRKVTREQLAYIGEWHSHPDGCACKPSLEDIKAGAWLAEQTRPTSLPGVMLIAGESKQTCWMLCSKTSEEGAPIHLCLKWSDAA
jgi:hypothetical protein